MAREAPSDLRELSANSADDTGAKPLRAYARQPFLQGGSVAIDPRGKRVVVIDGDGVSEVVGKSVSQHSAVCSDPQQAVIASNGRTFVSCGDGEVVALDASLTVVKRAKLGAEPFGLALSPDQKTLLVTTTSDGALHALKSDTFASEWSLGLPAHPRSVAIAPDGRRAVVAHALGVSASVVDLTSRQKRWAKLPRVRDGWPSELLDNAEFEEKIVRKAGGGFAVAMSPGGTRAFVPYLLKNSGEGIESFIPGCYANGSQLPVAATVAAVDVVAASVLRPALRDIPPTLRKDRASFDMLNAMGRLGQVRAAVHDPVRSRLLAVGEGSGMLMAFDTSKADPTAAPLQYWELGAPATGIAMDPTGKVAYVHLAFDRQLAVVQVAGGPAHPPRIDKIALAPSGGDRVSAGRKLFHTANDRRLAGITGVSCATCHTEGHSDGVTWLLDGKPLQTPNLAGRSDYHGAIRWAANSPDLEHSVAEAIKRLQGSGLPPADMKALAAFIRSGKHEMRAPDNPHERQARGAALFASAGCDACHDPAQSYSDGKLHAFRGGQFRTPSLAGLFLTAPYFHDGSASSLGVLLAAHEKGNPMAQGSMSKDDRAALEAFLLSL